MLIIHERDGQTDDSKYGAHVQCRAVKTSSINCAVVVEEEEEEEFIFRTKTKHKDE